MLSIAAVPLGMLALIPKAGAKKQKAGVTQSKGAVPRKSLTALDLLAESGFTAADTLNFLKSGKSTPLDSRGQLSTEEEVGPSGVPPLGVTINPSVVWPVPPGATGYNITLSPAETGVTWNHTNYSEQFALMLPSNYNPSNPPPLVIAWHGFGTSHNQPMLWGLPAEAEARGWMLMSPLGIAGNTFSWLPGQQAVEKSIDWLRANYPYDESRVYGLGFSMGAQCIVNFAARHQDPAWTRFAALATVCGSFDNMTTYIQGDSTTQSLLVFLFGGVPTSQPHIFEYQRTSAIRGVAPVDAESMARSVLHLPFYMTWSTDDTVVTYSPTQNNSLISYLTNFGNIPTTVPVSGQPSPHSWAILNVPDCFSFFSTKSLTVNPTNFHVLADRDCTHNAVAVSGGPLVGFRMLNVNAAAGSLSVASLSGANGLRFDADGLGLAEGVDATIAVTSSTGANTVVQLERTASLTPPSKVQLNGTDSYAWTFNSASGTTNITVPTGTSTTTELFATFDMALGVSGTPSIGSNITIDLTGGAPSQLYALLYAESSGLFAWSAVGDGDPRFLLLDPFTMAGLIVSTLDGAGQDHPGLVIPNDPGLIGRTFPLQAITAPGSVNGIPFTVGLVSNPYPLTIF